MADHRGPEEKGKKGKACLNLWSQQSENREWRVIALYPGKPTRDMAVWVIEVVVGEFFAWGQ